MAVVIYIRCWVDIGVLASSLYRYGSLIIKRLLILSVLSDLGDEPAACTVCRTENDLEF